MSLPSKAQALARVHVLADEGEVEFSRNARRDSGTLGYQDPEVWDVLSEIELVECTRVDLPKWEPAPDAYVLTAITKFEKEGRERPDVLFVEVRVNADSLFLLAFKLDGSPR
jgi:hypothetical protein